VILLWETRGLATGSKSRESANASCMRMGDREVDSSPCNGLWDLVKPGDG
jgi:hypothetical protein